MSPKVTGQHGKSQRLVGEKFLSQKKHVTLERVSATQPGIRIKKERAKSPMMILLV